MSPLKALPAKSSRKFLFTVSLLAVTAGSIYAQQGTGARFGARDPFLCASKKEPVNGSPSGQRLKDLVRCGSGGERVYQNQLYLFEDLNVEIGVGRPYKVSDRAPEMDPSKPVYPIRGSFNKYQC